MSPFQSLSESTPTSGWRRALNFFEISCNKFLICSRMGSCLALNSYNQVMDHRSNIGRLTAVLIFRIGKPGNVEDGKLLIPDPEIKETRSIGGDETALMHAWYVVVHTDKRLLIEDHGNKRIVSVKRGYHTEEKIAFKGVPDQASMK